MKNDFKDFSTYITNSTVNGSQIASGSENFQGIINYISQENIDKLEELTNKLVKNIQETPIQGVETAEIVDAIKQVETQVKQKGSNKFTVRGILEGIKIVVQNGKNISDNLHSIYTDWSTFINLLIS